MERLYKFTYSLLVVAIFAITFTSCIKEDMDDCPSGINVYFDYLPATYANVKEGINPKDVSQINLYYFDAATDLFLGTATDESVELGQNYYMTIPALNTGEYKFVAWGNLKGNYSIEPETPQVGVTTFNQLRAYLNSVERDSIKSKVTPLFFGGKSVELKKTGVSTQEIRIPIIQNTYTINLKVNGALDVKNRYKYIISDNNTYLGFDNSYIASTTVHYIAECGYPEKGSLNGSITTMRISEGRAPVLKVLKYGNEEDPIFRANLVELILKLEKEHKIEIDFSNMYEFDIEVTIKGSSFIIIINGWEVSFSEEELHR